MSILFIGKRFYTNRDAYSEKFGRIYQLPYYWAKDEHTCLWLIDYHSQEKVKDHDENLTIISTPIFSFNFFLMILKILFLQRPKKIIASGDCYIGILAFFLSKLCFSKFIFDVYDKYDAFEGYKNLGFKNLFQFLLNSSNANFFASQALMSSLKSDRPHYLVINGIDHKHFKPLNKVAARNKLSLQQNSIYVGYFGSMEADRGVEDLIEAVQSLNQKNFKITLLLGGKKPAHFSLDQNHIHYLGNVPFQDVPYALAACDILTIPYRRSIFMDAGASNKIAEAIACIRPIVATQTPNFIANFPKQAQQLQPYLAEAGNSKSLAHAIQAQLKDLKIVSQPEGVFWSEISYKALNYLNKW